MNYQRGESIGTGGMSEVFRGQRLSDGAPVALKYLRAEFCHDTEILERFIREAEECYKLKHPGIVQVFDLGTDGGQPFIVMELLEGQTLRKRLKSGALPERDAVAIASQILAALHAAHEKNIVHRDIKPGNIFLTNASPSVKVIDFGIAKVAREVARLTQVGTQLGTPEYMSPEQVLGDDVDRRSDIYSAGVLLYEMLSGAPPYTSSNPREAIRKNEVMAQHVNGNVAPPPLPEAISPALKSVVARALDKKPARRFNTAQAMRAALLNMPAPAAQASVAPSIPPGAAPKTPHAPQSETRVVRPDEIRRNGTSSSSNPLVWLAVALGVLLVLALGAGGLNGGAPGMTTDDAPATQSTPLADATPTEEGDNEGDAESSATDTQAESSPTPAPTEEVAEAVTPPVSTSTPIPTEAPTAAPTPTVVPTATPTPRPTQTATPTPTAAPTAPPKPVATPTILPLRTETQSRTESIAPGPPITRYNDSLPRGRRRLVQSKRAGSRRINIEVKLRGAQTVSRRFVSSQTLRAPQRAIYEVGTRIPRPPIIRIEPPRPPRPPRRRPPRPPRRRPPRPPRRRPPRPPRRIPRPPTRVEVPRPD